MPLRPQIVLAAVELDDRDFLTLALAEYLGCYQPTIDQWFSDRDISPLANQQNLVELHHGAFLGIQLLDSKPGTRHYAVLFTARSDYSVHRKLQNPGPFSIRPFVGHLSTVTATAGTARQRAGILMTARCRVK